jgi:hypothetical protein
MGFYNDLLTRLDDTYTIKVMVKRRSELLRQVRDTDGGIGDVEDATHPMYEICPLDENVARTVLMHEIR